MEAADKKGFGEEGILKAGISPFMVLSKLRPRGANIIQLTNRVLSVSEALDPAMVLGMALALKELPFKGGDKCAHRCCTLERHCPGQWGEGERAASGPSCCSLSLFLASPTYLFAACGIFFPEIDVQR